MKSSKAPADPSHDAFISYSRKDTEFATLLEKALEDYQAPKDLAVQQRRLNIFRDMADFTGGEYHQSLDKHLADSAKLIVICSPRARASPYVNDEIRRFVRAHGAQNVVSVLLAGIPNNEAAPGLEQSDTLAFPDALCEALSMPLPADYRNFDARTHKLNRGSYTDAWYKLLADLYGVSRSEIEQRDRKRNVRRLKIAGSVIAAIFVVLVTALIVTVLSRREAVRQGQVAKEQRDVALKGLSRFLASQSDIAQQTSPERGLLLAVEAVEVTGRVDGTVTAEADQALHDALGMAGGRPLPDFVLWDFTGNRSQLAMASRDGGLNVTDWMNNPPLSRQLATAEFKAARLICSANGEWLAAARRDSSEIQLWRLAGTNEAPLTLISGGQDSELKFSPDGRWLLAVQTNAVLEAWNLAERQVEPHRLTGHTMARKIGGIRSVSFSSDGRRLVSIGWDRTVRLWALQDLNAGAQTLAEGGFSYGTPHFSSDGEWLALAKNGETNTWTERVALWRFRDGRAIPVSLSGELFTGFERSDDVVVGFVSKSHRLVTATSREVWLWDLDAAEHTAKKLPAYLAALSSSQQKLALVAQETSTDAAHVVRVVDLSGDEADSNESATLNSRLNSIEFSPDGTRLVGIQEGGDVCVLDPAGKLNPIKLRGDAFRVSRVRFSPNSEWFVTSTWRDSRLWRAFSPNADPVVLDGTKRTAELEHKSTFGGGGGEPMGGLPSAFAFDPLNRWAAVPGQRGTTYLVPIDGTRPTPLVLAARDASRHDVTAATFSPDGQHLAVADWNYSARIWNLGDLARPPIELSLPPAEVGSSVPVMSLSPDGRWLAVGGNSGKVVIWDTERPAQSPETLVSMEGWTTSLQFSVRGRRLLGASEAGQVRLWDLSQSGQTPLSFDGHNGAARAGFSGDERWIVTAGRDATIRFWNSTNPAAQPLVLKEHTDAITGFAASRDGRWIVSASMDGTVRIWDCHDPLSGGVQLTQGQAPVNTVALSPDGSLVAAGDLAGFVRIWKRSDLSRPPIVLSASEANRSRARDTTASWALRFSPDGRYLGSLAGGQAKIWRVRIEDRLALACDTAGRNFSQEEWEHYRGGETYGLSCAQCGLHRDFLAAATNLAQRGHVDRATALFQRAAELQPYLQYNPRMVAIRIAADERLADGRRLARRGETNAALASLQLVSRIDPTSTLIPAEEIERVLLSQKKITDGERLARSGSLTNAVAIFREAIALDPGLELNPEGSAPRLYAPIVKSEGETLARAGRFPEAIAKLAQAMELDPNLEIIDISPKDRANELRADELIREAVPLARKGEFDRVLEKYHEAQRLNPRRVRDPEAETRLAVAPFHVEEGKEFLAKLKYPEAMVALLKAVEFDPKVLIHDFVWNELCWQGSKAGYAAQVLEAGERAVKSDPTNGGYRDSRGIARALTGQLAGAIDDFKAYVDWAGANGREADEVERRRRWINFLQSGKQPRTFADLEAEPR